MHRFLLVCIPAVLLAAAAACSDDTVVQPTGGAGGAGAWGAGGSEPEPVVTELFPAQPPLPGHTECKVTITDNLPSYGQTHLPVCTAVDYATNPPASGDHWGIWAEYRTFTEPVPRPMLVHDLEHGAIVMAYACDGTCATDAVAAFEDAAAAFGVDPTCAILPSNPPSRIVITPDPLLALPIGLSAWRATYTASCIDPPSLLAFIEDHYAKAPEDLCAQGKDPADPATGVPDCP